MPSAAVVTLLLTLDTLSAWSRILVFTLCQVSVSWLKNTSDKHSWLNFQTTTSSYIILGFFINMQVQGQHPHQWAPFQIAGTRSHTRSPGMSIMRVDSRELPLSAIPLCQLFPCHLGPMLSINLYVKGCLNCIIGAFHMSIPSVFSPSE